MSARPKKETISYYEHNDDDCYKKEHVQPLATLISSDAGQPIIIEATSN